MTVFICYIQFIKPGVPCVFVQNKSNLQFILGEYLKGHKALAVLFHGFFDLRLIMFLLLWHTIYAACATISLKSISILSMIKFNSS